METKQQIKDRPNSLIRHIKLLKRKQYQYDSYLIRKNNVRFNDTPIPHRIDRFISDFDHRNFTGLYFKYTPYYGHFREVLFFTTLQAGPARAVDFIKTLSEQSKDKISFYRQIKFEFTFFLNERILIYKKDYIEHYANTLLGEKWSKAPAEFIAREILCWSDKYLLLHERPRQIALQDVIETTDITPPEENTITHDIKESQVFFSWRNYKGHKKDFLMFCLIPFLTGQLEEKPGFTKKLYLKKMARIFNVDIQDTFDSNINVAIEKGSYHQILNDLIIFIKNYEKDFAIDQKNRGKNQPSNIKY